MNKSVLFYFQSNKTAYDQLSLALFYKRNNIKVVFYTPVTRGNLHDILDKHKLSYFGVKNKNINSTLRSIIIDGYVLFRYLKLNRISLFVSHLPLNNLLTSILSFLFKRQTKFITVRHHTDYILKGGNKKSKMIDCLINKLSPKIQVISDRSLAHMLKIEKVKPVKLLRLNLFFDFDLYPRPNIDRVNEIRKINQSRKILIAVGRLIPVKNHIMLFQIAALLKKEINFKLFVLGEGPEFNNLTKFIIKNELSDCIQLEGFKDNVFDYLKACDLVVHLSKSENSLGVAKEAAIAEKPFLGFKSVGDNNVILNSSTGYCLPKKAVNQQIADTIKFALEDKCSALLAKRMKSLVIENYTDDNLKSRYLNLIYS